jgi:hypothetical protein
LVESRLVGVFRRESKSDGGGGKACANETVTVGCPSSPSVIVGSAVIVDCNSDPPSDIAPSPSAIVGCDKAAFDSGYVVWPDNFIDMKLEGGGRVESSRESL